MERSAQRLVLNLIMIKSRGQPKARGFFFGGNGTSIMMIREKTQNKVGKEAGNSMKVDKSAIDTGIHGRVYDYRYYDYGTSPPMA